MKTANATQNRRQTLKREKMYIKIANEIKVRKIESTAPKCGCIKMYRNGFERVECFYVFGKRMGEGRGHAGGYGGWKFAGIACRFAHCTLSVWSSPLNNHRCLVGTCGSTMRNPKTEIKTMMLFACFQIFKGWNERFEIRIVHCVVLVKLAWGGNLMESLRVFEYFSRYNWINIKVRRLVNFWISEVSLSLKKYEKNKSSLKSIHLKN